jgi:hypothetical protein
MFALLCQPKEDKMKNMNLGLAVLLILVLLSCRTTTVNTPNYEAWLGAQSMPSQLDVTGKWDAGASWGGGWGEANLIQQGRNVYGSLGLYSVKGVVSKTTLFVTIVSNGYVYYTAKLDMKKDGSLSGIAVKGAIAENPEAAKAEISAITMKRMK